MYLGDYHLHTAWSHDSDTNMEDIAKAAIKRNLTEIVLTDHYELHDDIPELNYSEYIKEFNKVQNKFKNQIDIKLGIEVGISIDKKKVFSDITDSYDFDYVLASTHRVNYVGSAWPEFWQGLTKLQTYSKYFEYMYKSVKEYDNFDCWGHLDFIIRYGDFKNKGFKYSELGDILDEIMKTIIHKGKGIEINTSLRNKGFAEFHPSNEIISRYIELGGEIITVGSDSHSADFVGAHIKEAYELIEKSGLKYITTFSKRKPDFLKISNIK